MALLLNARTDGSAGKPRHRRKLWPRHFLLGRRGYQSYRVGKAVVREEVGGKKVFGDADSGILITTLHDISYPVCLGCPPDPRWIIARICFIPTWNIWEVEIEEVARRRTVLAFLFLLLVAMCTEASFVCSFPCFWFSYLLLFARNS